METGLVAQRAIEAATKFGTDLRRRRQRAEDDGFTSSVTTKARGRFQEVFLESQNQATEGAEDFAASFQKRLDRETEALIEAARAAGGRPSTRAIQDTRNRLQLLGAAFTGQAASFENNARIAKLSRDLAGGLGDLTRQAFDDPERRPELLDAADEGIDAAASFLPATELETLRAGARVGITLASVNGVIERDLELAAEMLEAGDFDEGLDTGRKAALIGGAKTAIRLEEESAARELAADRRELRRDADAAIAKLRGGQPVAELGALESRAETLADSDTGAALRHAEDDRFFMLDFARRPPAAQAELIAAMENGPELKPVETRRLAAMQAQAAVTERALAKDPLAYAQSTGVIDEPADITGLSPEALRARLRQAETAAEQFGLPSAPLLRPGEAEKIADKIATGTPEELQAKAEELADLPAEIRQAIVEEIGPRLPPDARNALDLAAETEGVGVTDQEALVGQAVAALLQGAPLDAVQSGLRDRGVDPAEFGVVPDPSAFDEVFVTEGPEGKVRVFGTKDGNLENLGVFGKRRGAITRAETLRGLGPDNAFRDLVPVELKIDQKQRPSLGTTGNAIRAQLESKFAKGMFENYWLGKGDVPLSRKRFDAIVRHADTIRPTDVEEVFTGTGKRILRKSYNFSGSGELGQAIGTASIFYNGPKAIGFYDKYDFDPKPLFSDESERTPSQEIQTRGVRAVSPRSAKPFEITYGTFARPPVRP